MMILNDRRNSQAAPIGNNNPSGKTAIGLSSDKTNFYGLFYLDESNKQQANLKSRGDDAITTYLKCAALAHRSFEAKGYSFSLITNDAHSVIQKLTDLKLNYLKVLNYTFTRDVPDGIPFYSAHFKLDLFSAFSRGDYGDRIGLVDIDTVLVREFDQHPFLDSDSITAYDITEQVTPRYGIEQIRRDLELVAGISIRQPRWYGGEFILGNRREFEALSQSVAACWNSYTRNHSRLYHSGDEMVVSAALALLHNDGYNIVDGGQLMVVSRWWTARTFHPQMTFQNAFQSSLLHLPSDKRFLASLPDEHFDSYAFSRRYTAHARKKLFLRKLINWTDFISRERLHVGSLS